MMLISQTCYANLRELENRRELFESLRILDYQSVEIHQAVCWQVSDFAPRQVPGKWSSIFRMIALFHSEKSNTDSRRQCLHVINTNKQTTFKCHVHDLTDTEVLRQVVEYKYKLHIKMQLKHHKACRMLRECSMLGLAMIYSILVEYESYHTSITESQQCIILFISSISTVFTAGIKVH